ncbi:MAG: enoyl-CoA hydratase/isomerase family protein [Acidobacteriota bacterium]
MATVECIDKKRARTLKFANPPRHYMTEDGAEQLADLVRGALEIESVRTIILTGTDDVFIRHYDISELTSAGEAASAGHLPKTSFNEIAMSRLHDACVASPKPVIAAINGTCMGGGLEIALACDLRIASQSVKEIGLPETRLSIIPGGGGTQQLPRAIGEAAALNMILRGLAVDADEAQRIGLVHEVAPDAVKRALSITSEISGSSPESIAAAKRLVRSAARTELSEGNLAERLAFFDLLKTDSAKAAMRRFFEVGEDILNSRP